MLNFPYEKKTFPSKLDCDQLTVLSVCGLWINRCQTKRTKPAANQWANEERLMYFLTFSWRIKACVN